VPGHVTDDEAAVLEAVGVSLHAVDLAAVGPTDRVAVVGAGPIGQLVIRALRARGVTDVVASEPLAHRRAAATVAGASSVWDPVDLDAEARHRGAAVVIECAGASGAIDAAIRLVEPGGRIVLVGIPGDDRAEFRASGARRKGLTLVYARRMTASDLPAALEAVASGAIDVRSMISDRFALADVQAAFERLASGAANKIVVRPAATD
jgi:L-iditol 2-dehydrogenase